DDEARCREPVEREQRRHDAERAADQHGAQIVEACADDRERDTRRGGRERREADRVEVDAPVDVHLVTAGEPLDDRRCSSRDGARSTIAATLTATNACCSRREAARAASRQGTARSSTTAPSTTTAACAPPPRRGPASW